MFILCPKPESHVWPPSTRDIFLHIQFDRSVIALIDFDVEHAIDEFVMRANIESFLQCCHEIVAYRLIGSGDFSVVSVNECNELDVAVLGAFEPQARVRLRLK